jgi:hypothetical protein
MLKIILSKILIAEATTPGTEPTWTGTPGPLNLGDLKGKVFMKLTWSDVTVDTQRGKQPQWIDAKMETDTLDVLTSATLTALQALRGKNCWMHCVPTGTISAANPAVNVKDFPLLLGGEIQIGDVSALKLTAEWPAADESAIYALVTTPPQS